jgi:RNA polymerase sigma factor (sigma-70 family)
LRRAETTPDIDTRPASAPAAANIAPRQALLTAFERDWELLLVSARVNVHVTGLNRYGTTEVLAHEVLSQACVTAMEIADRFDPTRPALPWLRLIIYNTARSLARDRGLQQHREPRIIDAAPRADDEDSAPTEEDLVDRLRGTGYSNDLDANILAEEQLALVSAADAELLRLADIEDRDAPEIAERLGIRVGAVYTRLNRARKRLRDALLQAEMGGR